MIAGIEPPQDETPPYCVSYSVGSTPSTDIDVVFSEDMDQSTFTNSNITVVGSISGSHPWSFSFVPGTFTLTIVPDVNFDYDETVTVTISTGVTDLAGNALESECSFDFEIGSCTWFVVTPWAGANGSISPSEVLIVCQGDDVEFTATPNTGYEVDRWFVNGIEEPFGGTNFTVYDIQSSVSVVVWFKVKPEPSGITVLSPNGGEVYEIDGRMTIIWTSTGDIGNHVRIELWRNGAFERLIEESEYNDGSTSWGIPWDVPAGGCYKVRIYSVADPSIWDESDDCFEIVPEIILPDTLLIYTIQDLQDIGSDGAHPSDTLYKLMNDINASGFPFQPIGPPYFTGVLDGQGYSVQYLEYKDENEEDVGLFSRIDYGGVVKNLTLLDPEFEGDRYVGAFAGHNAGSIINCTVTATVSGGGYVRGNRRIGGIAGRNVGVISQCAVSDYDGSHGIYVRAKVQHVGGIAGVTGESSTDALIAFCFVDCDIRGVEDYNGGIAGGNYATIIGCGFEGALYGSDWGNGGIVGLNHSGLVKHCYFVGYLQGDTFDGGIVGGFYGGTIENCYSAGTMVYSPKGGIVGRCSGTITNSFWDTQVTGCSEAYIDGDCTIINSHGETTSEMKKKATFTTKYGTNWDFDNVWAINEGVDYPKLRGIGDSLSAPDNVAASSDQSDGVHVSWDPVSFDAGGGSYSAVYSIYRSDSPDANPPETEVTGWREGNTLVDSTAVPGATYYYWVQAAAGMNGVRASELGGPAQGQRTYPLADTPTGILASDSLPHSIVIEWDEANVANFYQVYRSISVGGSKDSLGSWQTGLSYSDIPAYPDTVYYYWVRAAMDDTGGYVSEYGGPDSGYYIEPDDIAPTVSISLSPAYPIETQSCTLHVSAADNEALGYVALRWSANGVQDSAIWDNIGAQTLDTSHIIGAFSANDTIECWARALDVSDNPVESQHLTKIILFENVSQPSHPMGPVCLKTNQLGEFETGGSITNLDSPVQYRFNWADSISSWGDSTASRTWDSEGAYLIKSQARSLSDTNRVSVWSVSLLVVVDSMPPEVVIRTYDKTIVDTVYNTESVTISGDSRDDEPSSGLASTEINTGAENKGDEYDWSFDVSLDEGSNIFVITSTDNAGNVGVGTLNLILVGVDDLDEAALPDRFALNQNYPNPFNPATVIEFDLPRRSHVSIAIFNLLGQKVAGLIDEEYPAGSHQITWDGISTSGQRSASGIYFYRLVAEDFINTKKMILLK